MALITCENVSFSYDGNTVVSDLNFSVCTGDYLCVVGENGSGKSTLIKGLLRLKSPQSGAIRMHADLKPGEIGYLPQQTAAQKDFPAGAYEVVLSGRLGSRGILPFYSRADKEAAVEIMKRFDIYDLAHRCYRELSGGQQQRVLLARALCSSVPSPHKSSRIHESDGSRTDGDRTGGHAGDVHASGGVRSGGLKVLLLDEPDSGLDPVVTNDLYRQLDAINRESGLAIIMVSHDIHGAVRNAGKILHLKNKQIFFGETRDYINTPAAAKLLKESPL
ncbi:MAG: ATP-binding cassette domain-containing protein [Clostridiales Family XIII bacterium]|jgi:zinc transport system ATP-binding protein|nr:ATP-binding cassette domain-containing protein [Clostridiales Family XIII bacterium]